MGESSNNEYFRETKIILENSVLKIKKEPGKKSKLGAVDPDPAAF